MSGVFKATNVARYIFRGNMTSKRGNRRFYKGRGAPSMGHIVKGTDKYIITDKKYAQNTFSVPSLAGFKLKPYIAPHTEKRKVARPQLVVQVSFPKKLQEQRQIRITEQNQLESMLKKVAKANEDTIKARHQRSSLEAKLKKVKGELSFFKEMKSTYGKKIFERNQRRHTAKLEKEEKEKAWEKRQKVMNSYLKRREAKIAAGTPVEPIKQTALQYLKKVKLAARVAKVKKQAVNVAEQQQTVV